jgi:hypothetical protein
VLGEPAGAGKHRVAHSRFTSVDRGLVLLLFFHRVERDEPLVADSVPDLPGDTAGMSVAEVYPFG